MPASPCVLHWPLCFIQYHVRQVQCVLQRLPCRQLHHGDCIEQTVHRVLHPSIHPLIFVFLHQSIQFTSGRSLGLHWAAGYLAVLVFIASCVQFKGEAWDCIGQPATFLSLHREPETAFGQPGYPLQMACGMAYGMPGWGELPPAAEDMKKVL